MNRAIIIIDFETISDASNLASVFSLYLAFHTLAVGFPVHFKMELRKSWLLLLSIIPRPLCITWQFVNVKIFGGEFHLKEL